MSNPPSGYAATQKPTDVKWAPVLWKCKEIPKAHWKKVSEELDEAYKSDKNKDAWFVKDFLPSIRQRYIRKNVCPHCQGEGILTEPVKEVKFGNLLPRDIL